MVTMLEQDGALQIENCQLQIGEPRRKTVNSDQSGLERWDGLRHEWSRSPILMNGNSLPHGAAGRGIRVGHEKRMNPEIREFIGRSAYCQREVRTLAGMLPADNAALDALIGETVVTSDQREFLFLVMAALSAGRPVSARHLALGTVLIPDPWTLGGIVTHMQGDIATPLVEAVRNVFLPPNIVANALFLAAHWHEEHSGGKLPGPLIGAARVAVRNKTNGQADWALLHAVALISGDEGLYTLVLENRGLKKGDATLEEWNKGVKKLGDNTLDIWRRDPIGLVPEKHQAELATANTMRRAVSRIGRNEPCPCGSGKKYKHCCIEKDQERLRHSTEIAGMTEAELHANPEPFLTAVRIEQYQGHEVARFDPRKIAPGLHVDFLAKLCRCKLLDAVVEAMEKLGYRDELKEPWEQISLRVARAGRKDLVERMMKLNPEGGTKTHDGHLLLMMAEADPVALNNHLMESVQRMLADDEVKELSNFAWALLQSRLCPLGILVARSLIPILPQQDAARLLTDILVARDLLLLPPDEPFSDIMDKRFLDQRPDEGKDAEALREALRKLDAKVQEVQRYKESVQRLQKEVARREQLATTSATTVIAPKAPVDAKALEELRQKVQTLKSSLKERHQERNTLRQELQKAHTDLDSLRQKAAAPVPAGNGPETDREEDWLLPQDAPENQPVRVIEFPRNFQDSLASLPRSVARGTLTMLGRLAAGEPAAFVGAVRLKACPGIMRHRIGIDFRLLFRLLPDRVQVVDLIPRQDLERKIKTLV